MTITACVASSFPEARNRNLGIVADLAEGFREVLGAEQVHVVPFQGMDLHVQRLRPTLVVLVGSALLPRSNYRDMAQACRRVGAVFAFWTVEDPYEFDAACKFTEFADLVFTNDAWANCFYDHERVHHLPTAASPRWHVDLDRYDERPVEVFFCGVGFPNRQMLITDALPVLERRRSVILGENWAVQTSGVVANRRLSPHELAAYYASSRCVLNIGRDFSFANDRRRLQAVTPGPRTFEAAMAGSVQLYFQPSRFLDDYFELGTELLSFESVDELDLVLEGVLSDPAGSQAIAEAGQRRALAEHTYAMRAKTIIALSGLG